MTVEELKEALVHGYPVLLTTKRGERYHYSRVSAIITRYDSKTKRFIISAEVVNMNSNHAAVCRPEDLSYWEPGQ